MTSSLYANGAGIAGEATIADYGEHLLKVVVKDPLHSAILDKAIRFINWKDYAEDYAPDPDGISFQQDMDDIHDLINGGNIPSMTSTSAAVGSIAGNFNVPKRT